MSAFVVGSDTMDKCVAIICARGQYGQTIPVFAGVETAKNSAKTEIGRRLFTLNIEAVQQRYPDTIDKPKDMPGPIEPIPAHRLAAEYVYAGPSRLGFVDAIACVKSLQCLRYQCCEGDVDKSELYAELIRAIGAICEAIVEAMPDYERAPWG
jgi:hypothetical protein